jgi:hypothetical protein
MTRRQRIALAMDYRRRYGTGSYAPPLDTPFDRLLRETYCAPLALDHFVVVGR